MNGRRERARTEGHNDSESEEKREAIEDAEGIAKRDSTRHVRRPEEVTLVQNLTELNQYGSLRSGG